jgi:hypothetical protein
MVPTICGRLPELIGIQPSELAEIQLVMGEDDWRQCELIHASTRPDAEEAVRSIRQIIEDAGDGAGYLTCLLREGLDSPLSAVELTVEELGSKMRATDQLLGHVALRDVSLVVLGEHVPAVVHGGFSFIAGDRTLVYGVMDVDDHRVQVVGFADRQGVPIRCQDDGLEALSAQHDLVLADWVRGQLLEPHSVG